MGEMERNSLAGDREEVLRRRVRSSCCGALSLSWREEAGGHTRGEAERLLLGGPGVVTIATEAGAGSAGLWMKQISIPLEQEGSRNGYRFKNNDTAPGCGGHWPPKGVPHLLY